MIDAPPPHSKVYMHSDVLLSSFQAQIQSCFTAAVIQEVQQSFFHHRSGRVDEASFCCLHPSEAS